MMPVIMGTMRIMAYLQSESNRLLILRIDLLLWKVIGYGCQKRRVIDIFYKTRMELFAICYLVLGIFYIQ
jgi:hypothetical protein